MWNYINCVPESWRYGIIVLLVILGVAMLAKWVGSRQTVSAEYGHKLKHVVQESARWQAICRQDQNVAFAFMHANYAVAYANVVRLLMTDENIRSATGMNMQEFLMELDGTQQQCFQELIKRGPDLQPENQYAITTGWLG
jgi:hypothetical protein